MKQYLVMKVIGSANKSDGAGGVEALPGFYTFDIAQRLVNAAAAHEPSSTYMIQEVGTA